MNLGEGNTSQLEQPQRDGARRRGTLGPQLAWLVVEDSQSWVQGKGLAPGSTGRWEHPVTKSWMGSQGAGGYTNRTQRGVACWEDAMYWGWS